MSLPTKRPSGAVRDVEHLRRLIETPGARLYAVRGTELHVVTDVKLQGTVRVSGSAQTTLTVERLEFVSQYVSTSHEGVPSVCHYNALHFNLIPQAPPPIGKAWYLFALRSKAEAYAAQKPAAPAPPAASAAAVQFLEGPRMLRKSAEEKALETARAWKEDNFKGLLLRESVMKDYMDDATMATKRVWAGNSGTVTGRMNSKDSFAPQTVSVHKKLTQLTKAELMMIKKARNTGK